MLKALFILQHAAIVYAYNLLEATVAEDGM
jgi:hypothetical protein